MNRPILILLSILAFSALAPLTAGAKQVEYVTTDFPPLGSNMGGAGVISDGGYGIQGYTILTNSQASVKYRATVKRLDTNTYPAENTTIPVGTRLLLSFEPHVYTDIAWSGTGGPAASPYGQWIAGAEPPPGSCNVADKINNSVNTAPTFWTVHYDSDSDYQFTYNNFVILSIDPPAKSITPGANLGSCTSLTQNADGSSSMECTVAGAGAITPTFNLASTLGEFYYRIQIVNGGGDWPQGCFANQNAMTTFNQSGGSFCLPGGGSCGGFSYPVNYDFPVPAQSISFAFTGVATPQPPSAPTITQNGTPACNVALNFTLTATDPNGDQIRYNIDSDNNGTADTYLPSGTTYVASGASQTYTRTSSSSYTFRVQAQDSTGAVSGWSTRSVTVPACAVAPTPLLTANPATVPATTSTTTLSWSCSGTTTAASIDQGIGALSATGGVWSGTRVTPAIGTSPKVYTLTCTNGSLSATDDATVTMSSPADLIAGSITPTSVAASSTTAFTGRITNQGSGGTGSAVGYQFYDSATGSGGGTLIGSGSLSALAGSGTYADATLNYTYPAAYAGTTRYMKVCPDPTNVIAESNESNNCPTWTPITIGAVVKPNLVAQNPTFSPSPTLNVQTTISAVTQNLTSASTINGYTDTIQINRGSIPTLFSDIDYVLPRAWPTALAGNASRTASVTHTFTAADNWYVRACADTNTSNVGAIDEGGGALENNCSDWVLVTIPAPSLSCTYDFDDDDGDGDVDYGEEVTFSASGASSPYTWDPSDGASYSGGNTTTRTYTDTGTPETSPVTYEMDVSKSGYATDTCSVEVVPSICTGESCTCSAGQVSINATPDRVERGNPATLRWEVTSVGAVGTGAECRITSSTDPSFNRDIQIAACMVGGEDEIDTHDIETQTVFTIRCGSGADLREDSVTVNVFPDVIEY